MVADSIPTADIPLRIVSASRLTAEVFITESMLGRSLRLHAHRGCAARIHTANRHPLGAIYNQALEQLHPDGQVVFRHDDVWLVEECLRTALLEALATFDLVGMARSPRGCALISPSLSLLRSGSLPQCPRRRPAPRILPPAADPPQPRGGRQHRLATGPGALPAPMGTVPPSLPAHRPPPHP